MIYSANERSGVSDYQDTPLLYMCVESLTI